PPRHAGDPRAPPPRRRTPRRSRSLGAAAYARVVRSSARWAAPAPRGGVARVPPQQDGQVTVRFALATTIALLALSAAGLAAAGGPARPCSYRDAGTTINVGGNNPTWLRFCGRARGVLRLDGTSY